MATYPNSLRDGMINSLARAFQRSTPQEETEVIAIVTTQTPFHQAFWNTQDEIARERIISEARRKAQQDQ